MNEHLQTLITHQIGSVKQDSLDYPGIGAAVVVYFKIGEVHQKRLLRLRNLINLVVMADNSGGRFVIDILLRINYADTESRKRIDHHVSECYQRIFPI